MGGEPGTRVRGESVVRADALDVGLIAGPAVQEGVCSGAVVVCHGFVGVWLVVGNGWYLL